MSHQSVLLEEVARGLAPAPGKIFADGTVGYGGHAEKILERSAPDGRLIGFDKDPAALAAAKKRLERFGDRAVMVKGDFKNMAEQLGQMGIRGIHGALLDLGVSSPQLTEAARGFSFMAQGPLDMRMDPSSALTADEIVNRYPQEKLEQLLKTLGEERFARRIAQRIVEERRRQPIRTTSQLESIIFHAVPGAARHGRIHPATRAFQALRMETNRELESLQDFLSSAPGMLFPAGRLAIISFHSLEDRLVKNAFKDFQREGLGKILTRKPERPGQEEINKNPRSRSAKLRIFEKIGEEAA